MGTPGGQVAKGHLPVAADFSLKEEGEFLRLSGLRADEPGCRFRGEGDPRLQALSCIQLYFAVALSIFFCSIFLTLQHFWRTPFDKGQLYQTPTSVSLLFLSLGATLLGVFLPRF